MTVKELKEILSTFDENLEVKVVCKESWCAERIEEVVEDTSLGKPIVEIHYE